MLLVVISGFDVEDHFLNPVNGIAVVAAVTNAVTDAVTGVGVVSIDL